MNPRGGTVDGIRKSSMEAIADCIGCSRSLINKRRDLPAFDFQGHHVTLDPVARTADPDEPVKACPPPKARAPRSSAKDSQAL
jgi:hypothetical protein